MAAVINNYTPVHSLLYLLYTTKGQRLWLKNVDIGVNYLQYILLLIAKISEVKAKRVILIHQDRIIFLAALLAALQVKVTVVIPNITTPKYIEEIMQPGDFLLNDNVLNNQLLINAPVDIEDNLMHISKIIPEQAKIVFYTSGSSGYPQPITKTLANLEEEIMVLERLWGSNKQGITYFSTVTHSHLYGFLFSLLWPICTNKNINRITCASWEEMFLEFSADDYIISSPAHLGRFPLLDQNILTLQPKIVFSSGGPLSYASALLTKQFFGIIPLEVYGSTETGGIAYRQQQIENQLWETFPGITISTQENLLVIRSPYIDFGVHITQDLVTIVEPNNFILFGRADRILKIEGKRVSLVELERRLNSLEYVTDSFVFPLPRTNKDQLGAAIVLNLLGQKQLSIIGKVKFINEIKSKLLQFFELTVLPKKWNIVNEISVNSQGKRTYYAVN
jgi:acyl-coenzyme A synthetase/AMP-(fatty) acid ligase